MSYLPMNWIGAEKVIVQNWECRSDYALNLSEEIL